MNTVSEVFINYLRDVIHCSKDIPQSDSPKDFPVLNIDELPDEFKELGKELKVLAGYAAETRALANDLTKQLSERDALLQNETLRKNEEHEKTEKLAHWYHSILDAIPVPISVTDANMNWTFINRAVEKFLGVKRNDVLGKHCSNWNANICNTDACGIVCVKRGIKQTYFNQNNLSFKVDVGKLKDLNGEIAGFIEIVQDVTQIETMARLQADAEAASKAKSLFLANMSHEMRTPMNVILGIAEIELQSENLTEDTAKALGRIYESGDLLLNIINDILDLSKIEAGKLELVPVNYDIPSLINDTAQLNRLRFQSSPVEFTFKIDKDTPINLYGDELRIKQVLNNILSNAFKYTNKGSIEFSVTSEPDINDNVTMIFNVTDTGQGMTESQIKLLFDEYTRFNADANREIAGTGLGMSITRRLVDLMNGSISVKSEPGRGTNFTVCIPQKRLDSSVCGAELADKLNNFRFQSMAIAKKAQFLREYMPYGSVLIVDDVSSNIYVAKGMLSPYGLKIDSASSGFEAVEKIKNGEVYDIIFMDHMMPKMDGIETVKMIRSMGYKNIIIALTANVLIGQEKMFMNNGFDGFISKPIDSRELNHMLNEFIRNRKPPEIVEAAQIVAAQQATQQAEAQQQAAAQSKINGFKLKSFFIEDAKNAIKVLESLYEKRDTLNVDELKLYTVTVHGIKNSLININEVELSVMAYNLERASLDKNINIIANETILFTNALQALIKKFKNTNADKNNNSVNPEELKDNYDIKSESISSEDMLYLREKMREIVKSCLTFEKNAANKELDELKQKTWPEYINDILDQLTLHILHSAFKKAAALAEDLLQ